MGFNNSPSRGSKYVMNINSRFSELVVQSQLKGLLKDEVLRDSSVNAWFVSVKNWFEGLPGKADDKPRYKDDLPSRVFWDDKPKRILLSKYKEFAGCDFFAIGMNYGVLIGKTIVASLGGHEIVTRIIALHGLAGVLNAAMGLPEVNRQIIEGELRQLQEAVAIESRTGVVR